jgi:Ca2+-binding RTX toxin-like protein
MHGDAGDDSFSSHFQFGSGDDLYQGGSGSDHMNYFCPRCAVTLNGEADDGRINKGEHDNVRTDAVSIESHRPRGDEIPPRNYGSGEDWIEGDDGANRLVSFRGHDVLEGHGGRDLLAAGRGNDLVFADDGQRDEVSCGAGDDVAFTDPMDDVHGCEGGLGFPHPADGGA